MKTWFFVLYNYLFINGLCFQANDLREALQNFTNEFLLKDNQRIIREQCPCEHRCIKKEAVIGGWSNEQHHGPLNCPVSHAAALAQRFFTICPLSGICCGITSKMIPKQVERRASRFRHSLPVCRRSPVDFL